MKMYCACCNSVVNVDEDGYCPFCCTRPDPDDDLCPECGMSYLEFMGEE